MRVRGRVRRACMFRVFSGDGPRNHPSVQSRRTQGKPRGACNGKGVGKGQHSNAEAREGRYGLVCTGFSPYINPAELFGLQALRYALPVCLRTTVPQGLKATRMTTLMPGIKLWPTLKTSEAYKDATGAPRVRGMGWGRNLRRCTGRSRQAVRKPSSPGWLPAFRSSSPHH
jgi:hypothetical protein